MSATTNVEVIISAKDNASSVIKQVSSTVSKSAKEASSGFGDMVRSSTMASVAFSGALTLVAKSIIDVASDMQQAKVAFSTMLGSAELATKTLKDLSDFAKKTPFTFPSIVEASQRLLAYNVSAEDLIPTLKTLGDIAAGVGMEKMPQLILAFGQVKAATVLTGMELRQFSEAGVPLLQALVDQANETGGVLTKMGGASKETVKSVARLGSAIEDARFKMDYMKQSGKENTKEFQNLAEKIKFNEAKISSFGSVGTAVYAKVKTSAKELKDQISDGNITFDQVQKALQKMTEEGGKFYGLMDKQSLTFKGTMSNISDQLVRVALNIAGISTEAETFGNVIEGGAFDILTKAATRLLDTLNALEPKVKGMIDVFLKNQIAVSATLGLLAGGLLATTTAFIGFISPLLILMSIGAAVGTVIGLIVTAFGGFENIEKEVVGAIKAIEKTFSDSRTVLSGYADEIVGQFIAFGERVYSALDLDPSKISFVNFLTQVYNQIKPQIDNIGAQIKQGFTNALNIQFGGNGNIGDLLGKLAPIITNISNLFLRILTPAIETFKKSLEVSRPQLEQLLQLLGPLLINILQILAGVLGFVLTIALGFFSGIVSAVSFALPFVIEMFKGLAEFLNGIMTIIVGIFSLNWNMVLEGVRSIAKGIYDAVVGAFTSIIAFVAGFIKGIIDFFRQLYDILIGHSIIPEMMQSIKTYFKDMVDKVLAWGKDLYEGIVKFFDDIRDKIDGVITWIKTTIENFKPKISIGIDFPNLEDAKKTWEDLKVKARSFGLPFQTGGIVPGPIGAPIPILAHGGERVTSTGLSSGGGGEGITFNVSVGLYAGTETEKRNIAKDLYSALLQVAQSQNKTVAEFMSG